MIDRPLLLVCTDRGTHGERELVELRPVSVRVDLPPEFWRETPATRRGFAAQETQTRVNAKGRRTWNKTPVQIIEGERGQRIEVPRCPTCGRAPRLLLGKLLLAAKALQSAEDSSGDRLDISRLPSTVGN